VSSHGRRRGGREPAGSGPAQFGWAVLVIAAALIGGLAAATLVHASVLVAVIVSVVVGGVALLVAFRWPARPPDPTAPRAVRPAAFAPGPPDPVAPGSASPRPPEPDGQARETVVQLLPLPQPPGRRGPPDAPWWDAAQGAPSPSPGAKRAPAPDLSTYLAATFIAQCPRCGAFRLDIHRARTSWDFRCESCRYTWTWQPGTPWPPVRVKPRERPPAP
jgi:hypothetical protein